MPVSNLFKNCSYYYGFAAYVAYFVNHPAYTSPPETQSLALFALALLFQFSNLRCHMILSNLRAPGEKGYKIPAGFLFNYITCANYFAEIMGWVCFSLATQVRPVVCVWGGGLTSETTGLCQDCGWGVIQPCIGATAFGYQLG